MTHLDLFLEAHRTWLPPYFSYRVNFTFSFGSRVFHIQDCAGENKLGDENPLKVLNIAFCTIQVRIESSRALGYFFFP